MRGAVSDDRPYRDLEFLPVEVLPLAIHSHRSPNPTLFYHGLLGPTRGDPRQFPVLQEDFVVTKRFAVREQVRFEIQAQMFNAFNRHPRGLAQEGGPWSSAHAA